MSRTLISQAVTHTQAWKSQRGRFSHSSLQVFEDEGRSLNSLMYDSAAAGGATPDPPGGGPGGGPGGEPGAHSHLLQPSEWWHVLRRDTQVVFHTSLQASIMSCKWQPFSLNRGSTRGND